MRRDQAHYVEETQTVRRIAADPRCRWIWTDHAETQMKERRIAAPGVKAALTNGQVILQESKKDILWRVRGRDEDGRMIEVVVAVFAAAIKIKVVTAF
jgi:hypothetical protein